MTAHGDILQRSRQPRKRGEMYDDSDLRRSESGTRTEPRTRGRTTVSILAEIRLYREGLADLLAHERDMHVVAVAASWYEAKRMIAKSSTQIVLLDMATPGARETVREIKVDAATSKVIAIGVAETDDEVLECAVAGVSGYVTRDDSFETLVAAVRSASRGELLCTPRIAAVLFDRVRALSAAHEDANAFRLTPREKQIADLILDQFSNKAIAQRLHIELPTVKNHVHSIFEKLQVHRRSDAVSRLRVARELVRSLPPD
jgi:two-component system, NarL family, nitrate/nitrite response regulator NarL